MTTISDQIFLHLNPEMETRSRQLAGFRMRVVCFFVLVCAGIFYLVNWSPDSNHLYGVFRSAHPHMLSDTVALAVVLFILMVSVLIWAGFLMYKFFPDDLSEIKKWREKKRTLIYGLSRSYFMDVYALCCKKGSFEYSVISRTRQWRRLMGEIGRLVV